MTSAGAWRGAGRGAPRRRGAAGGDAARPRPRSERGPRPTRAARRQSYRDTVATRAPFRSIVKGTQGFMRGSDVFRVLIRYGGGLQEARPVFRLIFGASPTHPSFAEGLREVTPPPLGRRRGSGSLRALEKWRRDCSRRGTEWLALTGGDEVDG
eukprot:gene13841-biopygen12127